MSKNEIKLKPCPFCGATLYHAVQNYYYMCKTEGCFLNTHFVSESEVDSYNTRDPKNIYLMEHGEAAYMDKLEKQISTLQEKLRKAESRQPMSIQEAREKALWGIEKTKVLAELESYRWIPVSERLPEHDRQVWICYEKTGYTYDAYYDTIYKTWNIFDYSGGHKRAEDLPTHWREIDLPTGKDSGEKHNGKT